MKKLFVVVMACALSLAACGDDDGAAGTSGTSGAGGTGGTGGMSGTGGGDLDSGMTDAGSVSCADACTHGLAICPAEFGTMEECLAECPMDQQEILACVLGAADCAGLDACIPSDGDAGN